MRNISRALVAFTLSLAIVATGAQVAVADVGQPPVIGGGTGTDTGGQPTDPGPGSTGNPTPAPEGSRWVYGTIDVTPEYDNGHFYLGDSNLIHVKWSCTPKQADVFHDWMATSVWYMVAVDKEDGHPTTQVSIGCVYPAPPVSTPITCGVKASVSITKTKGNGENGTETYPLGLATKTATSAWANDRKSVDKCVASDVGVYAQQSLTTLGLFELDTLARVVPCMRRDYNDSRESKIVSCGSARDTVGTAVIAQVCKTGKVVTRKGASALKQTDFTWADCMTESGLFTCTTTDGPVSLNGRNDTDWDVLDNGNNNTLKYPALGVKGLIGGPKGVRTRLLLANNASPVRQTMKHDLTNPAQPFEFKTGKVEAWTAGDFRNWTIRWMAPGVNNQPFAMTKTTAFTGKVKIDVVTVEQVDIWGTITYGTATKTIPVSGGCQFKTASVNVFRARNASR